MFSSEDVTVDAIKAEKKGVRSKDSQVKKQLVLWISISFI